MQLSEGSVLEDYGVMADGWQKVASLGFRWLNVAYSTTIGPWMVRRSKLEDKLLRGQFGKVWTEWAMRTPYRVIPFVV